MRRLICDDPVSVGGVRHPTAPDADPVLHFATGLLFRVPGPSFNRKTPLHTASSKQPGQGTHVKPQQLQSQQLKPADEEQPQAATQQQQQPAVGRSPATTLKRERDLLIPILVAASLVLYALIAVLGLIDSLDTQQQADWQF